MHYKTFATARGKELLLNNVSFSHTSDLLLQVNTDSFIEAAKKKDLRKNEDGLKWDGDYLIRSLREIGAERVKNIILIDKHDFDKVERFCYSDEVQKAYDFRKILRAIGLAIDTSYDEDIGYDFSYYYGSVIAIVGYENCPVTVLLPPRLYSDWFVDGGRWDGSLKSTRDDLNHNDLPIDDIDFNSSYTKEELKSMRKAFVKIKKVADELGYRSPNSIIREAKKNGYHISYSQANSTISDRVIADLRDEITKINSLITEFHCLLDLIHLSPEEFEEYLSLERYSVSMFVDDKIYEYYEYSSEMDHLEWRKFIKDKVSKISTPKRLYVLDVHN